MKRVEADAQDKLSYQYVRSAKDDSAKCDLMISGARVQTKLIFEKFWYNGLVLECGTPRCDVFFDTKLHEKLKDRIFSRYGLKSTDKVVLYAPTFRRNRSLEPYRIEWPRVIDAFCKMLGSSDIKVFLRLHPNIASLDTSSLVNDSRVVDVTKYPDMQELMCVADVLITDYSSSMFDFPLLHRPCFLYATDVEYYDRGFYYKFDELPFPLARTQEQLVEIIESFNAKAYSVAVKTFCKEKIGLLESGTACEGIARWMAAFR